MAGLAHGRHQVATGEADRGDEAVDALVGQGVLLVKSAIQIDVGPVYHGGLSAGEGVLHADLCLAEDPGDHEQRRIHRAAGIVGQVDHHIFDGAALAIDLLAGTDDQADGIRYRLARFKGIVVVAGAPG